ncbi:hypothetical protein EYC84_007284 [Monilinia fructicola]|uniref:Uncharacterized protein n=1 Tax=Monilinia fructicola TaxID=38448 RepID=A0A5M9KAN5_MONFR|nr:hypothetical protein EYC84_007284 [Monilinia fructicola]
MCFSKYLCAMGYGQYDFTNRHQQIPTFLSSAMNTVLNPPTVPPISKPPRQTDEHSLNCFSNSRKEVKERAAAAIGIDLWYH